MGRNGLLLGLIFLLMIVVDRVNGLNFRELITTLDANGNSNVKQDSPSPSPQLNKKKPNVTQVDATKPDDIQTTNPSVVESEGLHNTKNKTGSESSTDKQLDKGKSQDVKEKGANTKQSMTITSESCKGRQSCSDQKKSMVACVQNYDNGSNQLTVLVQNEGDTPFNVTLTISTSVKNSLPPFEIPSHQSGKINVTSSGRKSTKIILNAGNGDCELLLDAPKSKGLDDPPKSKGVNDPPKSEGGNDPSKSEGGNDPSKSEGGKDPSKTEGSKDPSKSEGGEDPSKSEGKDPSKTEGSKDPSKSEGGEDPSKSEGVEDTSKSEDMDSPPKSKSMDSPPKSTSVNALVSQSNLLKQLSFYSKQVTPIYGVYFAFLVALVIGGTWACCSFRKRRTDGGVPYQELEMGLPASSNAVNVEMAEGWEDWDDDDWDEDTAIRSPGGGHAKSISSNGLTSRTPKKDGWDADWDN